MAEEIEEMIMLVRSKQRRSIQRATSIYTTQGSQAGINAMGQPFNSSGMERGVVALPGVNLAGPNPRRGLCRLICLSSAWYELRDDLTESYADCSHQDSSATFLS